MTVWFPARFARRAGRSCGFGNALLRDAEWNAPWSNHPHPSQAVARRLMFLRVVLEVVPQVVGERVFVRRVGVEDAGELRPFGGEFRELERAPRLEPDEEDALPVLWHDALRVDDLPVNLVAERIGQRVVNDLEGATPVVPVEMLHVLQHEGGRLVVVEYVGDGEEEVALFHVLKAVLAAEAVLLGDAREAEGLAGKAAAENVELGDVGHGHGMDVAVRRLAEVGGVGPATVLVPVAGEDAPRTRLLEGEPEPADAAKEVNETEGLQRRAWLGVGVLVPSEARRSGAVGRGVFVQRGRAALLRRPNHSSGICDAGREGTAAGHCGPAGIGFSTHASTPLQSSPVVRPRALASLATFLMPGFRSPRSMPEM